MTDPDDGNSLSNLPAEADLGGRLGENIMHFGRVLRAAGLPVGPGQILDAINAVLTVGLTDLTLGDSEVLGTYLILIAVTYRAVERNCGSIPSRAD